MWKFKIFFQKGYSIDKQGIITNSKGDVVKGSVHTLISGYKRKEISIRNNGKLINICVHRLQAYQKFGKAMFEKGVMVRHLDGDSLNNFWDNIQIGTNSENQMDVVKEKRIEKSLNAIRIKQDNIRSVKERYSIYEDLKNNVPYSEIMSTYKITSKGTLSFMKNKSLEYKQYLNKITTCNGA